jgi:DNA replication and repair protein RecF
MHLDHLSLVNFRNYDQTELSFSSKINFFAGNNGTGKTNLLDAIYYLSLTKSYFNNIDSQNIRHDEDFFVIQGDYIRQDVREKIYCGVRKGTRKSFRRNGREYSRFSEHVGLLPVVMVSPADSSLITEGSEERRKFMDAVISQYDVTYLDKLIRYNRALVQRNVLLKDFARKVTFKSDSLDIWDEQLASLGSYIYSVRSDFIRELIPVFQKYYTIISEKNEQVQLRYQSQLENSDLKSLLKNALDKDRLLQYTTAGTHKDDLILLLGDHSIRTTGSQGQQKTYLVALKLAKFDYIRRINGFSPIMLLDDIFDKFDARRVKKIIELVAHDSFGQIFITDTSRDRIKLVLEDMKTDYKVFTVERGHVTEDH